MRLIALCMFLLILWMGYLDRKHAEEVRKEEDKDDVAWTPDTRGVL